MKTTETKSTHSQQHAAMDKSSVDRAQERPFFSESTAEQPAFFQPEGISHIQPKMISGARSFFQPSRVPHLQAKCAGCEAEERQQEKEQGNMPDVQRMATFGSDDETKNTNVIQRLPAFESDEATVQAKSTVGQPRDKYKQDQNSSGENVAYIISSLKGGGQPLTPDIQEQMGIAFNQKFDNVRIHNDSTADRLAHAINAKAFTTGKDIFFRQGAYVPQSSDGKETLAHELTHVLQQEAGPVSGTPIGGGLSVSNPSDFHEQSASRAGKDIAKKLQRQIPPGIHSHTNLTKYHTIRQNFIQRQDAATSKVTPGQLIAKYTNFIGALDEKELGKDLANRLPDESLLVSSLLNNLSSSDRDDVAYEITSALEGKLANIPDWLRIRLVSEMADGVVTDKEEGAIAKIWLSFGEKLSEKAEKYRSVWKKSLWESDQLGEYLQPQKNAFKSDVIGLAIAYIAGNKYFLLEEAKRYGIDLEGNKKEDGKSSNYLERVRAVAPMVLQLKNYLNELLQIHVGYNDVEYGAAIPAGSTNKVREAATFNPESEPTYRPNGTESPPWPKWKETKKKYVQVNAIISKFADFYPSIYILIQRDKLEELVQADKASKAQEVINESIQKTSEKLHEAEQKILTRDIEYYDLLLIQSQLFSGSAKNLFIPSYPWDQPFYQDIAKDVIKGYEARKFWADLGLSLAAAAALIAAPFTGGASVAFLVGFGLGIGATQAGMSWEKYADLSTLADAEVKKELTLVTEGEVSAELLTAIIESVSTFLDFYGVAKAGITGAKVGARMVLKETAKDAAERKVKKLVAQETRKRLLEAGKEAGTTLMGASAAIGLHELAQEEAIPKFDVNAEGREIDFPLETTFSSLSAPSSSVIIQRAPGGKSGAGVGGGSAIPTPTSSKPGPEFEMSIERALKKGEIGGVPQMDFVIPGQYTGSGWGIDRFGIRIHEKSGRVSLYHFEMKYVAPGSEHVPKLGTPKAGTQTGRSWTQNAVNGLLDSQRPEARAMRERLRRALRSMYPGESIDINVMRKFLNDKLVNARVIVITPDYADLRKIYKQVASFIRWGRKAEVKKVKLK